MEHQQQRAMHEHCDTTWGIPTGRPTSRSSWRGHPERSTIAGPALWAVPELWKTHRPRFPQARWTAHRARRPHGPQGFILLIFFEEEKTTDYNGALHLRRLIDNPDVPAASLRSRWAGMSDHDGLDEVITMPGMRTLVRHGVRDAFCWRGFPSVRPLPSAASAAGCPALFGSFVGITGRSDFPEPVIVGVRRSTSRRGPQVHLPRATLGSPGSRAWCVRACTGSLTARGPGTSRGGDVPDVAFRLSLRRRHPGGIDFRG